MMNTQDDDDSRGSVGSPTHYEFDHESISEFDVFSDEEYIDDAENSGMENDYVTAPPIVEPTSPELPAVPSLKKIPKRKTTAAAGKNVPIARMRKTDTVGQAENAAAAGAFEKKKAVIVPKKRPTAEPAAKNDSVEFGHEMTVAKRKPVPRPKHPAEQDALPFDGFGKKPKVSVRKSRKLVATATEDPLILENRHRDVKLEPEVVSSPPDMKGLPLTSFVVEAQVHAHPHVNVSRQNVIFNETPAESSSLGPNIECADRRFWMEILAGDFKTLEYNALLQSSQFTQQQTYVLQQSFSQLCRKLSDICTYSDRFMKTHKCIECEFSISHQCVSINFAQYVPSSADLTGVTTITSQSTIMCICQFGFFHSHAIQPRVKLANNLSLRNTSRMLEHNRSVSVSCPRCHINIVMKNRNHDVCCDFTNWNSLEGANRRQFYSSLENRLQSTKMNKPYLNELYACNKQCCHLFHRCAENAIANDAIPMRPH